MDCLPSCVQTCQYMNTTCTPSTTVCTPGCSCPANLVFNGTYCVNPTDCPCYADDHFREPGSTWNRGCKVCTCWENKVTCVDKSCSPVTYCPEPDFVIQKVNCCDVCLPVTTVAPTTVAVTTTAFPATLPPPVCFEGDFHCGGNASCISTEWLCDGNKDCTSGTDEQDCPARVGPVCNKTIG